LTLIWTSSYNIKMKLISLSAYLLIITSTISLSNASSPNVNSILDHKNPGCPENTLCSKSFGEKRTKWKRALKSKIGLKAFTAKYGSPLQYWSIKTTQAKRNSAHWDSQCFRHHGKNISLMLSETFAKKYSELNLKQDDFVGKTIVKIGNKFVKFPRIPFDSPVAIKNKALVFNKEEDGIYYSLSLFRNGVVKAHKRTLDPKLLPKNIKCSEEMTREFAKLKAPNGLYESSYCRAVWDEDKKVFRPLILGWSCN